MKTIWQNYTFNLSFLIFVSCLLVYATNALILNSSFFAHNGEYFSSDITEHIPAFESLQKWIYLSTALYLVVKVATVTLILFIALYLREGNPSYGKLLSIVARAELIFVIPAVIKIIYFSNLDRIPSLAEWHQYYFLSMLMIIGDAPADWQYALTSLNLFEVLYWFILAFGLSKNTRRSFDHSLKLLVSSYLPALLIWITMMTLFSVLYFPSNS